MGASISESLGCCVRRESEEDANLLRAKSADSVLKVRFMSADDLEDMDEEQLAEDRERWLDVLEEPDSTQRHAKLHRFYTAMDLGDLEQLEAEVQSFCEDHMGPQPTYARSHTLVGAGYGPWGIGTARGGTENAWTSPDATTYNVRGPTYLSDKKKVLSGESLAELAVMDLFMSEEDIANVARNDAAKTIQRLRRDGETRKLLILNFRLVPLHVIAVWALPPPSTSSPDPARALLDRFVNDMSSDERNQRLKVIPRLRTGPYPIRRLVGENSPAILGKGIPVAYFPGENELEVSVSIAASAVARRVSRTLVRAGSALDIELVILLEGKDASELPEQILGGFRVIHADLGSLRKVEMTIKEEAPEAAAQRPSFLPPTG